MYTDRQRESLPLCNDGIVSAVASGGTPVADDAMAEGQNLADIGLTLADLNWVNKDLAVGEGLLDAGNDMPPAPPVGLPRSIHIMSLSACSTATTASSAPQ